MKNIIACIATLVIAAPAMAIYAPDWERPILASYEMEIQDARFDFTNVVSASLTLNQRDDSDVPTSLTVELHQVPLDNLVGNDAPRMIELEVTTVEEIECGSRMIYASLPQADVDPEDHPIMARFSVALTDHTTRVCDDQVPNVWIANVREGYGWCGTMDASMTLLGDPEHLKSVMSE